MIAKLRIPRKNMPGLYQFLDSEANRMSAAEVAEYALTRPNIDSRIKEWIRTHEKIRHFDKSGNAVVAWFYNEDPKHEGDNFELFSVTLQIIDSCPGLENAKNSADSVNIAFPFPPRVLVALYQLQEK